MMTNPGLQQTNSRLSKALVTLAVTAMCPLDRQIARGLLTAVAFCHERGVGHGSLGAGSVLVSTFDDRRADQLIVKLTNFGFARQHSALQQPSLDAGAH